MYSYFVLLFCVSAVAASCGQGHTKYKHERHNYHGRHHHYGRHRHLDTKWDYLARELAHFESKAAEYCNESTVERYDNDKFRLVVKLEDYDVESIVVKAKYRVLLIKAEQNETREEYRELRVIPKQVDVQEGFWNYADGLLTILFPYSLEIKRCGLSSDEEKVLPMREDDMNIDVRFGIPVDKAGDDVLKTESPKVIEESVLNERAQ